MLGQAPAGILGHKISARKLWTITNLIGAAMAGFTPLGAFYGGWMLICIISVCQGFVQVSFIFELFFNEY